MAERFEITGTIYKVAGPLIVADGMQDVNMHDVVRVSDKKLIGEIIELRGDKASIQVYEDTTGIGPGEPVYVTGEPLSAELAPGLIESIFDGIERPLTAIYQEAGDRIPRGIDVPKLDRNKNGILYRVRLPETFWKAATFLARWMKRQLLRKNYGSP